MARPLRIEYAGALYHVTSRGDHREDIYHDDDEDRLAWLDVFPQVCGRFNWRCYAWCLMDNRLSQTRSIPKIKGEMKEISEWFCIHYSTVSRAVKLFEGSA